MERIDRRLSQMARTQHGLITFDQALGAGLGRGQIQYRTDHGDWIRLATGVYAFAGTPDTPHQRALVACLAAPSWALLSHLSAAWLHGLWSSAPVPPHVVVPMAMSSRSANAVVHRARLGPDEGTTVDGIPVTGPARTVIDCAGILGPNQLRKVVDEAFHRGIVTVRAIESAWDHARLRPGRRGEAALREMLDPWRDPIAPGSPAELRLVRLLTSWGLPEPQRQVPVSDQAGQIVARIDVGWPEHRIGIEYDSTRFHGRDRWAADEARHKLLGSLGWTVHHADKADLEPGRRELLDAVRATWPTTTLEPSSPRRV